jgi:hypothetical protein
MQVTEEQFFNITEKIDEALPGIMEMIAYSTSEYWKSEARGVSTDWGKHYANSIKVEGSGVEYEVSADEGNKFVNFVEHGVKSFSIKEGLLRSNKAKIGPSGIKYIIVPFPVRTPTRKGQGKVQSRFGGREMTEKIYNIVKSGGTYSGKLKSGQEVTGLKRWTTKKFHSAYGMFLCVSENSKGWIHSGVPAEPVFKKVEAEVNRQIAEILDNFCKAIVEEFQ